MSANTFGQSFRVTTFGESHGPALGCVLDGCPPGLPLDLEKVQAELSRRRPGQSAITTTRAESDTVEVLSGLDAEDGLTLGTPIALVVRNSDQKSGAYEHLRNIWRPGHADWGYEAKFGIRAFQGGGRSSARETVGRVAAGAVARQLLLQRFPTFSCTAWVERVKDVALSADFDRSAITISDVDTNIVRCPDPQTATKMEAVIREAQSKADTLGGLVGLCVQGLPAGLGDPVFDKLTATLAHALCSIPAVKGIEFGSGFAGTLQPGSQHNDVWHWKDEHPVSQTNHHGGILGGISTGMPILLNVAFKPIASIGQAQTTIDRQGKTVDLQVKGRHDPCVLPRAVPIVEAMACLALCDAWLTQRAQVGDPWRGI
jgi:chorismate synthase